MSKGKQSNTPRERKKLPLKTTMAVLTEAGYRCAVPTCRGILALDMHHILELAAGGGNEPSNLIALCPTCHALYHRGIISPDSIYAYKAMLVSLSGAFDHETIDRLIFLGKCPGTFTLTGDGLLHFARLIAAGLAEFSPLIGSYIHHQVSISKKGRLLVEAWQRGDRASLSRTLSGSPDERS